MRLLVIFILFSCQVKTSLESKVNTGVNNPDGTVFVENNSIPRFIYSFNYQGHSLTSEEEFTFTCVYDQVLDENFSQALLCSSIQGLVFDEVAGSITWDPLVEHIGMYEFKVSALSEESLIENIFNYEVKGIPNISDILDQVDVVSVNFQITDPDSILSCTNTFLSAQSSLDSLLPDANITFSGTAPNCIAHFSFTASSGSSNISLTVIDPDGHTDSTNFDVSLTSSNANPVISSVADQTINEDTSTGVISFSLSDADSSVNCSSTYLSVSSSGGNTALASPSTITLGGFGTNCTILITPNPNDNGSTTVNLILNDGDGGSVTESFLFTVNPINDAPVLTGIPTSIGVELGDPSHQEVFEISDIDSVVTCSSSVSVTANNNTALINNSSIVFSQSGGNCLMTLNPNTSEAGSATISVELNDGFLRDSSTFSFTISNGNSPPTISNIDDQGGLPGETITLNLPFTISDADETLNCESHITYNELSNSLVRNVTFSNNSSTEECQATIFADTNNPWSGSLEFIVTDSEGASDSVQFSLIDNSGMFVSHWAIPSNGKTISLPLPSGLNYNFTVNWGDGSPVQTITSYNDSDISHTYAAGGGYTIKISGLIEGWSFGEYPTHKDKIIAVSNLGDVGWKSFKGMFENASNLGEVHGGNTSQVTTMENMFYGATNVNPDTSGWITSNVFHMGNMFRDTMGSLSNLDTSNWNTSDVTFMDNMFASSNANPDVSNWNVSSVYSMGTMFAFNQVATPNVSNWDISNVFYLGGMFMNSISANPDLSLWNFNNSMCFAFATPVDQVLDGSFVSKQNYSHFLEQMSSLGCSNQSINVPGVQYQSSASAARNNLINNLGWSINDGGQG